MDHFFDGWYRYADWCGFCVKFKEQYRELDGRLEAKPLTNTKIRLGQVDIDKNPGLASRFFLTFLPALYHVQEHEVRTLDFRAHYFKAVGNGRRDAITLYEFLKADKWKDIEPWGWFFNPWNLPGVLLGWLGRMVGAAHVPPITWLLTKLTRCCSVEFSHWLPAKSVPLLE